MDSFDCSLTASVKFKIYLKWFRFNRLLLPSLNELILYQIYLWQKYFHEIYYFISACVVFVKSAKRYSASTEQKGVSCQHGKVQEVCSSKKMESKYTHYYQTASVTHHIPETLHFDSFLPKKPPQTLYLSSAQLPQARHNH